MTTAGPMMTAGPVASMIVPSTSPIPAVTLKAMSAPWAPEVGTALAGLAASMLVGRLVAVGRRKLRFRSAPDRIRANTATALARSSSRVAT